MTPLQTFLRIGLDRAAAAVLAVGLIVFAFAEGTGAIALFFAPIVGALTGSPVAPGSPGQPLLADLCFLVAVFLFGLARVIAFGSRYRHMRVLTVATSRRRKRAGNPIAREFYEELDTEELDEAELDEAYAPTEPGDFTEAMARSGPSMRSRLARARAVLGARRAHERRARSTGQTAGAVIAALIGPGDSSAKTGTGIGASDVADWDQTPDPDDDLFDDVREPQPVIFTPERDAEDDFESDPDFVAGEVPDLDDDWDLPEDEA